MPLAAISDIHIHERGDPGGRCLEDFGRHPLVASATHVGLLGDIFDLMAGDHPEYVARHAWFFEMLRDWCESGKVVIQAEGNHDMHLTALFARAARNWSPAAAARLVVARADRLLDVDGRWVFLGHGDTYNREDFAYLRYKRFITSDPLARVADHVMPYGVLKTLGEYASARSRQRGGHYVREHVREKFRSGVRALAPSEASVVVGGHSHLVEEYAWDGRVYLNNGFPPKSRRFSWVTRDEARLVSLDV